MIVSISSLRPNPQSKATVRLDNAPGFIALLNDVYLSTHNIFLDDGRIHNKNKNPVIDKGIQELGSELLRMYPEGGSVTAAQLAVVVNQLNSRIRNRGLSSWEILSHVPTVMFLCVSVCFFCVSVSVCVCLSVMCLCLSVSASISVCVDMGVCVGVYVCLSKA